MKNENEIKRAFAMEVIEKLNKRFDTLLSVEDERKSELSWVTNIIKSLLPKEEEVELKEATPDMQEQFVKANPETKTESDEVKAGEQCEVKDSEEDEWFTGHTYLGVKNSKGQYLCEAIEEDGWCYVWDEIRQPQTLEQKARKKAEEMWNDKSIECVLDVVVAALLIDPKTL